MEYFPHISARIPFPIMQEHCGRNGLPTAQGWEKLETKLAEEVALGESRRSEISTALAKIFNETISVGARGITHKSVI